IWFGVVLALAFARDTAAVLIVGCLVALAVRRTRRWLAMAGACQSALLVPALSFGLPVRREIAYTLNRYRPVRSPTWSYIFGHYPAAVGRYAHSDLTWVAHHPANGATFVGGLLAASVAGLRKAADPFVAGVLLGGFVLPAL